VRAVADSERIGAFMTALAQHATADVDVFLVGGTSAVFACRRSGVPAEQSVMTKGNHRLSAAIAS